jgi:hypothetical protein
VAVECGRVEGTQGDSLITRAQVGVIRAPPAGPTLIKWSSSGKGGCEGAEAKVGQIC